MEYQYHIFSPYRVCPLGAHVDHQHSLVTGFAINKGVDMGEICMKPLQFCHAGIICLLGQEFVMHGLLAKEDARLASRLLNMRQMGDYDDLFDWNEEDIAPLFPLTEALLQKMKKLLSFV